MKSSKLRMIAASLLAAMLLTTAVACTTDPAEQPDDSDETTAATVDTDGATQAPDEETEAPTDEETEAPTEEATYTVKFMDGNKVVLSVEGKTGDIVVIPEDPTSSDGKHTFKGWEGLDDADYAAGQVEIFKENLTFTAKWAQQFGTDNVYTATRVKDGTVITADGDKDEAYNDATAIEINTAVAGAPGATAKLYIMWDTDYYYIFVEVTDENLFTYNPDAFIENNDGVEFRMDLLHSDALMPYYNGGWGGSYRNEPGPMVEAGFKIGAGVSMPDGKRFGAGAEAYWEWWSHAIDESGEGLGVSKVTETGYTVEYKLEIIESCTDEIYRPHEGQIIGFGIRIYDKTAEDGSGTDNKLVLETINDGMDNDARALSSIMLVANPNP